MWMIVLKKKKKEKKEKKKKKKKKEKNKIFFLLPRVPFPLTWLAKSTLENGHRLIMPCDPCGNPWS